MAGEPDLAVGHFACVVGGMVVYVVSVWQRSASIGDMLIRENNPYNFAGMRYQLFPAALFLVALLVPLDLERGAIVEPRTPPRPTLSSELRSQEFALLVAAVWFLVAFVPSYRLDTARSAGTRLGYRGRGRGTGLRRRTRSGARLPGAHLSPAGLGGRAAVLGVGRPELKRRGRRPVVRDPTSSSGNLLQMTPAADSFSRDVVVVGGCGHVGLPLALAFAARGLRVTAYDVSEAAVDKVNGGTMPFQEPGADALLAECLKSGRFDASTDPGVAGLAEVIVVVIGTPVDEHQNPDPDAVRRAVSEISGQFQDGQLLVLRSTLYPGVTRLVAQYVAELGRQVDVAFCPERIAEGKAFVELYELPQLVSGIGPAADRARLEAVPTAHRSDRRGRARRGRARQVVHEHLALHQVRGGQPVLHDRQQLRRRLRARAQRDHLRLSAAKDLPGAGFAAGPCLFKDTAQLAAFNNNNFPLGNASMLVNEGLPLYLVAQVEESHDLSKMTVGILGMAFKGESDDIRSSLSYKLRRILRFKAHDVLCSDPYVTVDPDLLPFDEVLERADLADHRRAARSLRASCAPTSRSIDIWNMLGRGVRV